MPNAGVAALHQLATALPTLSREQQEAAVAHIEGSLRLNKYIRGIPTLPQMAFMLAPHLEAFFGGAAGPGKSWALLAAALQWIDVPTYAAIIFRRTYQDLALPGALMDRAHEWLSGTDARWTEDTKTWLFPSGATLTFGYLDHIRDKYRYQGSEFQFCVAGGTQVRLGDGSSIPIEHLRAGMQVMTLEGPRPVKRVFGARADECVTAQVFDAQGRFIGQQVHPVTHRILTPQGWLSAADALLPFVTSSPTRSHAPHKSVWSLARRFLPAWQMSLSPVGHWPPQHGPTRLWRDHLGYGAHAARSVDARIADVTGYGKLLTALPHPGWCAPVVLHAPSVRQAVSAADGCGLPDGLPDWAVVQDFLARYGSYFHPDDAQFPCPPGSDQHDPPSLTDVGAHSPPYWPLGGGDNILAHNHRGLGAYVHPYTRAGRCASEGVQYGACWFTPVGTQTVYDITVDSLSHYITASTGLSNQNCGYDELTQIRQEDYKYLFSRLRKAANSPVPLRVRSASNPPTEDFPEGEWVTEYFVDDGARHGRLFIPAKLDDNPHVDKEEYLRSLDRLDEVTKAQLRDGNWKVKRRGNLFLPDRIRKVPMPTTGVIQRIRYWDKAGTEGGGAYTAGVRMSRVSKLIYGVEYVIEHVYRGQWSAGRRNLLIRHTAGIVRPDETEAVTALMLQGTFPLIFPDAADTVIWIEQEPGSGGKESAEISANELAGREVHIEKPTGEKSVRAKPFATQMEFYNVGMVEGEWNRAYLEELVSVPRGLYWDQTDASSGAFNKLCLIQPPPPPVATPGRARELSAGLR